jgi:hypothetical protein
MQATAVNALQPEMLAGIVAGRRWAETKAEAWQLQVLEVLWDHHAGHGEDIASPAYRYAKCFWQTFAEEHGHEWAANFLTGFIKGSLEIWISVKQHVLNDIVLSNTMPTAVAVDGDETAKPGEATQ